MNSSSMNSGLLVRRAAMGLGIGLVLVAPLLFTPFQLTLLNYIGVYALVALGLVLLTGMGGLTSFGQAAFVGIGAYATAWLTTRYGLSPWLGLVVSLVVTGTVAALLGAVTLRLGGHFLPLSTIAWGIAIFFLFGNIPGLGGHDGLSRVPPVTIGGFSFAPNAAMHYLVWAFVGAAAWLIANLLESREGRAIRSLRGGAVMVESLGVSIFRARLMAFVIAALLAAASGWLYAHMVRFVSPAPFDVRPSIDYLLMAMAGGSGHVVGAILGSAMVTLLKNWLQDVLPWFTGNGAQFEIVVFSLLFVLLLQYARGGVMPFILRLLPPVRKPLPAEAPPLPRRDLPARGAPLLKVEGMTKRFGGLVAVNAVGFELKAGEILGLIGPNGAGKSTMFNLVTGALAPNAGRVTLAGTEITGWPQRRIASAGVARTFQHVKLRPSMSLLDSVALGAYVRTRSGYLAGALRLDRAEEKQAQWEALRQLRRVGLGDKPHELAGNLPLGSQRSLEVARALAADPSLVVLDEPAAGLRRQEKQALADLLRSLREEGVTILLVEHDMEFVMGARGSDRGHALRLKACGGSAGRNQGRRPGAGSLSRRDRLMSAIANTPRSDHGQPMLEVDDLHVAYGKVEAVRGVSLRLRKGEIITVIGPNGAGKTTLLNAVMGLLPSRGRLMFEGESLAALDVEERVERGLCLVPEKRELFGDMSVADNLVLGGYVHRGDRAVTRMQLDEVYARFPRLAERRPQLASTLSGGERQMLALGRALMAKPRVLLLDEPSLGLAPLIVREILRIVGGLRELGVSVLLVEQNARAALETADYGYVLETGNVALEGRAEDLMHDQRVVATYLGGQG